MKVGTTPLIVQVPETPPMRKRMRVAPAMSEKFRPIAFSNSFQGVLKNNAASSTQTPDETSSATWLAPRMASLPKMPMLMASSVIRTRTGIRERTAVQAGDCFIFVRLTGDKDTKKAVSLYV